MKKGNLAYRAGTYRSFLAGMLRAARRKKPLARLNTQEQGDFTNALLSAWARVCDVLTFYQERIANEGYLPTATEPVSVLHLAAAIGAQRIPAVGAQTHLALQLIDAAGRPDRLTIDSSQPVAVQNAPAIGDLPVVFECSGSFELRPAWNALSPAIEPVPSPAELWPGCRSLLLAGTETGVRAGKALLLSAQGDGRERSWLVLVDQVQVDRARGCTMVGWSPGIPASEGEGNWRLPVTRIILFERNAGLFGRTALAWSEVADKTKEAIGVRQGGLLAFDWTLAGDPPWPGRWRAPEGSMPPPGDVRALLALGDGALLAATGTGIFRSADGGLEWRAVPLLKGHHDVLSLFRDSGGRLYAGTAEGLVFASTDGGGNWDLLPRTVTFSPARQTNFGRRALEFLGVGEAPVATSTWELASPIRALLVLAPEDGSGPEAAAPQIYAGTDRGVFTMQLGGASWTPFNDGTFPGFSNENGAADISVAALALFKNNWMVAATGKGLFVARPEKIGWHKPPGPGPQEATALCVGQNGAVSKAFAGTPAGVFASSDLGAWSDFNAGLEYPAPPIFSLAMLGDSLFAATGAGIYVTSVAAANWKLVNKQELAPFETGSILYPPSAPLPVVRAVHLAQFPLGWWRLSDRDLLLHRDLRISRWVDNPIAPQNRLAVADGSVLASLPLGPILNAEWPDFAISGGEIYLDRKIDDLDDDSLIVLAPAGSSALPEPRVYQIETSGPVLREAFGKQATVTMIAVAPDPILASFDLRSTRVYLASRPVTPFTGVAPSPLPIAGDVLILAGDQGALAPGRMIQVGGPRPRAVLVGEPGASEIAGGEQPILSGDAEAVPALDQQMVSAGLREMFAGAGIKLAPECEVTRIARGARWLIRDGDRAWWILLPPGPVLATQSALSLRILPAAMSEVDVPTVLANDGQWQPAGASQQSFSEIVTIEAVVPDPAANVTRVTLTAPLQGPYDRTLCRICANVVPATQGESVPREILGSGQSAQSRQSFRLHRAPLTYTRDPGGQDVHSKLVVEVNSQAGRALPIGGGAAAAPQGDVWREVATLALAGPSDRVYAVSTDAAGRAIVSFGDGVHGARLPSGNDNVTAVYRFGAGAQGNVPAGSLIALRKRPAGVRSVTNPVAASGGVDAETTDALSARAPLKFRHFDRVVTLSDYRDYAESFAGIGKARVALVDTEGEAPTIVLTAATEAGFPSWQAPALREALTAAIAGRHAARLPLRVEELTAAIDVASAPATEQAPAAPARRDPGGDPRRDGEPERREDTLIYRLLPELYRSRDAGSGYALKALSELLDETRATVEQDIAGLYRNWFVETADLEMLPYLAGLVGQAEPAAIAHNPRALVADAIALGRRKGTHPATERMMASLTGWPVRITVDKESGKADVQVWREAAQAVGLVSPCPAGEGDTKLAGCYRFHPMGVDCALFSLPRPYPGIEAPFVVELDAPLALTSSSDPETLSRAFAIQIADENGELQEIPFERLIFADLGEWRIDPSAIGPEARAIVDPALGRFKLIDSKAQGRRVAVSFGYAAPGNIGGGPYERKMVRPAESTWLAYVHGGVVPTVAGKGEPPAYRTLAEALEAYRAIPGPGLIRILDSGTHDVDKLTIGDVALVCQTDPNAPRALTIEALSGEVPTLRGAIGVQGAGTGMNLVLSGLWLDGQIALEGKVDVLLAHCSAHPISAIGRAAGRGEAPAAIRVGGGDPSQVKLRLHACLAGPLRLAPGVALALVESVIDGHGGDAIAGQPSASLARSTILGGAGFARLEAVDTLFHAPVQVDEAAAGRIRFGALPNGADLPGATECVTDQAAWAFSSIAFGKPGYARLAPSAQQAVRTGASNASEIGAFNAEQSHGREQLLKDGLKDFLPIRMDYIVT